MLKQNFFFESNYLNDEIFIVLLKNIHVYKINELFNTDNRKLKYFEIICCLWYYYNSLLFADYGLLFLKYWKQQMRDRKYQTDQYVFW